MNKSYFLLINKAILELRCTTVFIEVVLLKNIIPGPLSSQYTKHLIDIRSKFNTFDMFFY